MLELNFLDAAVSLLWAWAQGLGAAALILLGLALIIYSTIPRVVYRLLAAPAGIAAVVAGLWLAFSAHGEARYRAGLTEERGRWQAAAERERQFQAGARAATEQLGRQFVDALNTRMAGLEQTQREILSVAQQEDDKQVPDGCRDVYRGLPPGVLRGLDAIR
ncbi:MAG: hypothetical protein K0R27_334 [Xanthobacteraceae bacterium]|jgi:hypothetical protein|nr:hypothetical protein [Xanthobacteraceae bacterium]